MTSTIDTQSTAIPFIYLQNDRFIVSQQAKHFLSQIKNPICVLTIVGKYRTGKSLFLNRIMLGKSKAFKVSPTINSCTRGLWLWKDTLKFQNEEQQKQVLIIDTEGFGATEQSDAYNNKILLFALLLSSYFVYNSVGSIDENSLNTISVLANLANEIQSKNSKDQNIQQYFPSFLWLVRDFTLNLVDKNDFPIQAKEYLQQALEIQKGTSNLIQGKNRIRRMMKHFFTDRDCFTMVRPVQTEDKLQQLDTIQQSEFRQTFLQQARTLRQKILLKIKPKRLKNTLLTGESLFELAQNYVQVINSNSLPNFQSSYKHLLKIEMNMMKKRIFGQNQSKARQLARQSFSSQSIRSYKQFQSVKQSLISQIQKSTKQKIKAHHSLSAFFNSQQILLLINEVKSTMLNLVDKYFNQTKQQLRYKYLTIVNQIKQDNMMSQSLQNIHTEKQFKQFINTLNQQLNSSIHNEQLKCPQFILTQFYSQLFQPYVQQLQEQFGQLSTKRLDEQNKEMKIKLQMIQKYLNQKQSLVVKMQQELKDQRRLKSDVEIRVKMIQKQLSLVRQDSVKKQQQSSQLIKQLQQQNITLQNKSIYLKNQLQTKTQQINTLQQTLTQTTSQLHYIDKQLALTKQRLQSKSSQLNDKKIIIQGLNKVLDDKSSKIQSLLSKIEQLRQSKQQLYEKLTYSNQQSSVKILNLQKNNTKLSSQIKQIKKIIQKTQYHLNQSIKMLKQQLSGEKQRYQQLLTSNQRLNQNIKHLQQQLQTYNKKQQNYKTYKKCIKNSSSIQCLHCTRFFMSSIFLTHLTVCTAYNSSQGQYINEGKNNNSEQIAVQFKVTNVVLHENNNKPFTVYQLQCMKGDNKWMIEKKFTQFCQLNQNLQASLPGVELSSAKTIFDPKYLSKKSLSIQEKQFLIQRYFNDLGKNVSIVNNKYWQQFIYSRSQQQLLSNSLPITRRTALNQLTQTNTNSNNQTLNYQMRKSQFKEQTSLKSTNNNSQSLKKQSLQTPQQFFKIWQQKQLRSKASSTCLKKTMHNY